MRKRIDCVDGPEVVLYVWYDNEFGYSCQVVRVIGEMAGVHPPSFPATDGEGQVTRGSAPTS